MLFAPDNYTETDALIYELQQEIEKYKGQLVTLFERVSGCEITEFTDEQVSYLADMIEGQMDAYEGCINKMRKQPTIADYIKDNEADWKKCHRSMVNISELKRIAEVE